MSYLFQILTLFPGYFENPLQESILGRALKNNRFRVSLINIRNYASGTHRMTDDTPYGGGAGMVMKPEPVVAAIEAARERSPDAPVILLTPQGTPFEQRLAESYSTLKGLTLVCGRYEGFDHRIRQYCDKEISIGDFVLCGGEVASLAIIESISRLLPGVLGNEESSVRESFSECCLEYPQYTRPYEFRGAKVPDVLLSGNHGEIRRWRQTQSIVRTQKVRPDLYEQFSSGEENKDKHKRLYSKE